MLGSLSPDSDVDLAPVASDRVALALRVGVLPATIFVSAFLLFQIQPLIARVILPWFGGAPAVWTAAMLFFQGLLLAGYGYAHLSVRRLGSRAQAALHVTLLLAALALLPVAPAPPGTAAALEVPTAAVLQLLTIHVGLPYFVLASTSPLLQAWFARLRPGASPYRLYALSNAGSLLALLSYPFLVEPALGRSAQLLLWSAGFGLFALGSAVCALVAGRRALAAADAAPRRSARSPTASPPTVLERLLWLALAAVASTLLLAITNRLCQELTVIPFLWVLPLALYLLSFILVFDREGWYRRAVVIPLLCAAMVGELVILSSGSDTPMALQIAVHAATLFLACLACHGELARRKPEPAHLTGYYLAIAAGGVLGGVFVAIVALRIFTQYLELHWGLWACAAMVVVAIGADPRSRLRRARSRWPWVLAGLALVGLGAGLTRNATRWSEQLVAASRNFYGVARVIRSGAGTDRDGLLLANGSTTHGVQFRDPAKRRWATTYYSTESGAGLLFRYYRWRHHRKIGVVGLGIGTLATYGREDDTFRFYEIDPRMVWVARTYFRYLADSPAAIDVILGDARLSLEREPPQGFDLLFLDAFTGHSVPTHLLTREAFELYDRHLAPGGVIAVHISHPHLDLKPVLRAAAEHLGMHSVAVANFEGPPGLYGSVWMLLSRSERLFQEETIREAASRLPPSPRTVRPWTDDYANVLGIVTFR
jgi:spermidine synthase